VKDKQHSSAGAPPSEKNIDDISGVQAEKNSLQRLMSTQILTIGGASLILVLSLWSMFHLARRASEGISTETIDAKNQEADARTADRNEPAPPTPAEQPAAFTPPAANSAGVARPQFKAEGGSLRPGSAPNALAEKERLAREEKEREQRERQREEEDKQERERQLRELEGRDQSGENAESPPSNGAEVAAPPPEDGSQPQPITD
jgi:type IV secretory pathway VirB10-like protein